MDIIDKLEKTKGESSTSMITLILPTNANLGDLTHKLNYEYTTASNIRNRTNRQSVQSAIKNIKSYLGSIKNIPNNGCAIFAGKNSIDTLQEINCYV